jgi:hypothetical protein
MVLAKTKVSLSNHSDIVPLLFFIIIVLQDCGDFFLFLTMSMLTIFVVFPKAPLVSDVTFSLGAPSACLQKNDRVDVLNRFFSYANEGAKGCRRTGRP